MKIFLVFSVVRTKYDPIFISMDKSRTALLEKRESRSHWLLVTEVSSQNFRLWELRKPWVQPAVPGKGTQSGTREK